MSGYISADVRSHYDFICHSGQFNRNVQVVWILLCRFPEDLVLWVVFRVIGIGVNLVAHIFVAILRSLFWLGIHAFVGFKSKAYLNLISWWNTMVWKSNAISICCGLWCSYYGQFRKRESSPRIRRHVYYKGLPLRIHVKLPFLAL